VRRRRAAHVFAAFFTLAGVLHFVVPGPYLGMMPPALPQPLLLVYVSGAAEIAGGLGLLASATRRAAAIGLILLLLAVFPANVQMLLNYRARGAGWMAESLLWLRLPFQFVLIWWLYKLQRPRAAA
jgi:uncharacterized membrane protein